jgi:hypothetical protein
MINFLNTCLSSHEHNMFIMKYDPLCLLSINIFLKEQFSEFSDWILTKLHRNDPLVVPYQS